MTAKKKTKTTAAAPAPAAPVTITAYKGFSKDWKCRDFQFALGQTYEVEGPVKACESGFHACENPLDVFSYYRVGDSQYAIVEQSGELSRHGEDTKVASSRITIKASIDIAGMVKAAIEWTRKKASEPTSGPRAHSATSGYGANSATSGDYAHSATSGNYAHSATSGDGAHSATSGYGANSATSGYGAQVEAKGKNAVAANAGNGKARAGEGGAIFLVERDSSLNILSVFASKVGENGIEPDKWYRLRGGKPVEVAS